MSLEPEAFIAAVKGQRDEAIRSFTEAAEGMNDGTRTDTTFLLEHIKSVDQAIMGVLDLVEERYTELVEVNASTEEDSLFVKVDLKIVPDLSTAYFDLVSN